MGKLIFCALIALFVAATASAQQRRDGNWWRDQTPVARTFYVLGLMDGSVELAERLEVEVKRVQANRLAEPTPELGPILQRYGLGVRAAQTLIGRITAGQLADGVSQVYEDAANRLIPATDAACLFLLRASGTASPDDLQSLLLRFRQAAR